MQLARRPAQTMLEMVIAIGIIIVSVLTATTLIVSTIGAGRASQNRIEAANIAREGIEIVRGIRDANWLRRAQNVTDTSGNTYQWDMNPYYNASPASNPEKFLGDASSRYYVAQFTAVDATRHNHRWQLLTCNFGCLMTSTETRIFYKPADRVFTQGGCIGGCTLLRFKRRIIITRQTDSSITLGTVQYLNVVSEVQWQEKNRTRTLTAHERLYDWQ
jgi:Tfp pilus assembly protein PilV